jgi:hypothetical protein
MRGYSGIDAPLSACLHFVRNLEVDDSTADIFATAKRQDIAILYVDYRQLTQAGHSIFDEIAERLQFEHRPYACGDRVRFVDDLITLAYRMPGLVIVVDYGSDFLSREPEDFFDLIEVFMVQFHHWLDLKKPCHLCFQMEQNEMIGALLKCER